MSTSKRESIKRAISRHWELQPRDKIGRWRVGSEYIPIRFRKTINDELVRNPIARNPIRSNKSVASPVAPIQKLLPPAKESGQIPITKPASRLDLLKKALIETHKPTIEKEDNTHHQKTIAEAQEKFDKAANNLRLKKSQLDSMGKSINTNEQAARYKKLKESEIPQAHKDLEEAEKHLNKIQALAQGKFKAGTPMPKEEIEKPLAPHEQDLANQELKFAGDPNSVHWLPKGHFVRDSYERDRDAYRKAKAVAPDLTIPEFKAINNYTGAHYVGMNGALRGLQIDPNSEVAHSQRVHAKILHQALQKAPVYQGEVRRDTRIPTEELESYKVGSPVVFHGVTSTTRDLSGKETENYGKQSKSDILGGKTSNESSKASKYEELAKLHGIRVLPHDSSSQVEYRIHSKSGRLISDISRAAKESEVALPHGFKGKISKIEDRGDRVKRVHIIED